MVTFVTTPFGSVVVLASLVSVSLTFVITSAKLPPSSPLPLHDATLPCQPDVDSIPYPPKLSIVVDTHCLIVGSYVMYVMVFCATVRYWSNGGDVAVSTIHIPSLLIVYTSVSERVLPRSGWVHVHVPTRKFIAEKSGFGIG